VYYIDTSAVLKLIVAERGSAAMRRWLGRSAGDVFSADLLRTETLRVVRRSVPAREMLARDVLGSVLLLRMSVAIFERAAMLEPRSLRSLDALHLASAMEVGEELEGLVTYDDRLAQAADAHRIKVVRPR
jgi:predicted nucleic acid-binding protein